MHNQPFNWYTTPRFKKLIPLNIFHKEQDTVPVESAVKNYHCLARAYYDYTDKKATLLISADDCYKLYINGEFICCGPAPSYNDSYYYNKLDITQYLRKGKNVIAVHLYYQGLINRVWQSGDNRFGVGASINGVNLKWKFKECKAFSGHISGYDTAFSENFDSRLWEEDWNTPDYNDTDWEYMAETNNDYSFRLQQTKPLSYYSVLPKNVHNSIYDFGGEYCGRLKIRAKGERESKIIIRCGEELNDDFNVRYRLRTDCVYEETWTLDDGICTFENYDYKGFRYVQLISDNDEILSIEMIVCHYPFDDEMCTLKSNDKKLEEIFNLCKRTIKVSCQNTYIDCPTREKGQYLGDTLIAAGSQMYLTKDTSLLRKAIVDFAKTTKICDGLMAVSSCSLMQEIADYSLLFGELLLLEYSFSKDEDFLNAYYETAKNVIRYFEQYEDERGLLNQVSEKWNLVDWPENCRDTYDFLLSRPIVEKGVHNVINAYYIGAIKTLGQIETILGLEKTFDFSTRQNAYVNAFLKNGLFNDGKSSKHSSLHSNVFALYFDLVPENAKPKIIEYIVSKGFCCGVYTSYFMLESLCKNGCFEDAYRLIVNETEFGWLNMLREGATTCFEVWGREQKWNTSLCHSWATAPITIIIKYLANADIPNLNIELLSHGGKYSLSDNE
ncbi:MAG: family 78 glycoside hydrolase catalytic domain [Clostridiales bacterium]|nr:family 78 glycoside hydrolase catalytic domain [Clostridiales bacterium]